MNPLPSSPSRRIQRPIADGSRPPEGQPRASPGSRSELADLVEDHADLLVWHAFRLLGSMPDAEDVVQDVFIRVFASGRRDDVASIRAYLYRAVGNACTDLVRSRTRSARRSEPIDLDRLAAAADGPPEAAQAVEELCRIEALLGRLPREQAEAIRLRVLDGLRLGEIAEVLDCPINTVSSRLRYGFQKLREAIAAGRRKPMNCQECRDWIDDLLLRDPDEPPPADVADHLAGCDDCAASMRGPWRRSRRSRPGHSRSPRRD